MAYTKIGGNWTPKMREDIDTMFAELYKEYTSAGSDAKEAREKALQAVNDALAAKDIAETTREEMLAIIREQTQNGDLAPEIAQARQGKATLGDNLNSIKSDLAQTEDKLNVEDWELQSRHREKKGIVVFISDDGFKEEYTILKPIMESVGAPACIAVSYGHLGKPEFCNEAELKELQNDFGWEIMGHGYSQTNPTGLSDEDAEVEIGLNKTRLNQIGLNVQSHTYPGDNYGVRERKIVKKYFRAARSSQDNFDGINVPPLNTHELKTFWVDSEFGTLRRNLNSYSRAEAIQRTLNEVKEVIDEANEKNALLIISTHTQYMVEQDFQDLLRDVALYAKSKTEVMTLRDALNQMGNLVDIGDYSQTGYRGIGSPHLVIGANGVISGSTTVTERDAFTFDSEYYEFPHGVTYVPISSNLAQNSPTGRAGTLINYRLDDLEPATSFQEYISYDRDDYRKRRYNSNGTLRGWIRQNDIRTDSTHTFDPSFPYSVFPDGIIVSYVSADRAAATFAPEPVDGLFINIKINGYRGQEYHTIGNEKRIYTREVLESGYGDWNLVFPKSKSKITSADDNNFSFNTGISDFPLGMTYSLIDSSNPYISEAPEGRVGTLVTHKISSVRSVAYNIQLYYPHNRSSVYQRQPAGDDTWTDFVKINE